jgi:hypothetical protein
VNAAADPVRAAARRRLAEMAWLAPLVAIGLFCLVNRLNESGIGFNDAAMARGEPSPVAAMRHLFPTTNPELDDAVGRASGKQEDLARAVAFFRGWMRTRTDDILHAPDAALLAVAEARLHVLLAARAEDPSLCLQYAQAPAGGLVSPRQTPSPLLALAVDEELVQQVSAARAGVDSPTVRSDTPKVWALASVKRRADWVTRETLQGSPRLKRLSASRRCTAYVDAYRLALALPAEEGARVAAALFASAPDEAAAAPAGDRHA